MLWFLSLASTLRDLLSGLCRVSVSLNRVYIAFLQGFYGVSEESLEGLRGYKG